VTGDIPKPDFNSGYQNPHRNPSDGQKENKPIFKSAINDSV
jgi:hypothetical protein